VHLGVADPIADLALRETVHEAQSKHLPFEVAELGPARGDRLSLVGKLVHDGVAMLRACGLHDAAGAFSAATSGRASGTGPDRR